MAASISGVGVGLGLPSSTKPSKAFSRSSGFRVKMTVSVEDKKKSYTLKKSEEAFNAAKNLMPGGVNSSVRAFKSVGGQPIVIDSVKGSHMWDIDGNEYIDYVGSWGPAIIGHADDELTRDVHLSMHDVLCLARAVTGREKIIKFEGCYHGHADPFLVKAGSGVATLRLPDSPGVPKGATLETLTAPFNDISAVENLFNSNKGELVAIILEPVVGNSWLHSA
ncbi:hypothetical protein CRYUN_Cryun07bG0017600 [Craigia yunnanensis]